MSNMYYVLLGDVRGSRRLADREGFGHHLRAAYEAANRRHGGAMRARIDVLKGIDEIGGVFTNPIAAYQAATEIRAAVKPVALRFVLVRGIIDAGLSGDVADMDGPAFHAGSRLMGRIKRERVPFALEFGDVLIDGLLSVQISLVWMLREGQSERQMRVIQAFEEHGNQTEAGKALGVTQQAVSSVLMAARYRETKFLEERVMEVLSDYVQRLASDTGG